MHFPSLPISGTQIIVNDAMCLYDKWVQVRFPKSKKKRIRKKWSKRRSNYAFKQCRRAFSIGNTMYVSSIDFEALKLSLEP